MSTILASLILIAALPVIALGLFVVWHIARPQRAPADTSNRINKVRLLWFALTREELFVSVFPWLRRDEAANMQRDGEQ